MILCIYLYFVHKIPQYIYKHIGKKPHSCKHYNYTFSGALQIHMMAHTGEKPYITRLTYNCAHLRSTKESLTIEYKEIILDVLSEIFLVKNFFG